MEESKKSAERAPTLTCPGQKCGKKVYAAEAKLAAERSWHPKCMLCATCGRSVTEPISWEADFPDGKDGDPVLYCKEHFKSKRLLEQVIAELLQEETLNKICAAVSFGYCDLFAFSTFYGMVKTANAFQLQNIAKEVVTGAHNLLQAHQGTLESLIGKENLQHLADAAVSTHQKLGEFVATNQQAIATGATAFYLLAGGLWLWRVSHCIQQWKELTEDVLNATKELECIYESYVPPLTRIHGQLLEKHRSLETEEDFDKAATLLDTFNDLMTAALKGFQSFISSMSSKKEAISNEKKKAEFNRVVSIL